MELTSRGMLKSTFKVNNYLITIVHQVYFKTENRPNLIKKSLYMIVRGKSKVFDCGGYISS